MKASSLQARPALLNNAASTRTKKSVGKRRGTEKTPRPRNAFMIYLLDLHATIAALNPGMHNNDICQDLPLQFGGPGPQWISENDGNS
ncbi:hypothetical protein CERZMDRAFT_98864 [Cercospora zeae-maydis SCOH1-5]|uniref:HMG box domain-containing protein n=1 Tax=Cercospora zeae-maydis SCOH1-5 TaxID=717836 RepID=A0A6A6FCK0_9PEZI|nr:hypothetical protein CERZMDRAFT_98864 [Cercospora zeae-maydis SCOH1-5]